MPIDGKSILQVAAHVCYSIHKSLKSKSIECRQVYTAVADHYTAVADHTAQHVSTLDGQTLYITRTPTPSLASC